MCCKNWDTRVLRGPYGMTNPPSSVVGGHKLSMPRELFLWREERSPHEATFSALGGLLGSPKSTGQGEGRRLQAPSIADQIAIGRGHGHSSRGLGFLAPGGCGSVAGRRNLRRLLPGSHQDASGNKARFRVILSSG